MRSSKFLSPHVRIVFVYVSISILSLFPPFRATTDTITVAETLFINQTLISAGGKFELGFFSKGNPKKYYVGIWYADIPSIDIVWVANRDAPLSSDSSSMKIGSHGNLVILDGGSSIIRWFTNQSTVVDNTVAQLLESGNLVVREAGDENPDHYLWQSFDHPTDTLLPGQELGWNLKAGMNRILTSWVGPNDPKSGGFSFGMEYDSQEISIWQGGRTIYRPGSSGLNLTSHTGPGGAYYTFKLQRNNTAMSRLVMNYTGLLRRYTWIVEESRWKWSSVGIEDQCDYHSICGPYGICNKNALLFCECPIGFMPKNPQAWALRDGSNGCVRKESLDCHSDGFLVLKSMKLIHSSKAFMDTSMNLDQCKDKCGRECDCVAYANLQVVHGVGTGCVTWNGDLEDVRTSVGDGQDLYLRIASSELGYVTKRKSHMQVHVLIGISTFIFIMLLAFGIWKCTHNGQVDIEMPHLEIDEIKSLESLQFSLNSIKAATRHFSQENKLGKGGFGEVYKGVLENGQEIAVKRLSTNSTQGVNEFKTEVLLVAKLQHNNLVKLLGFCLASKEKILIYEYMRNSSLDQFLFDLTKRSSLDWRTRFKIVVGIARGLMYLHVDSRLKIIHRDLKASNILLDDNMNPKISDFGLAKLFRMDQTHDNTRRIVGTYGYMAPEYAMTGHFSIKSDVYSFGIIVLEIVSSQRNKFFGRHQFEEALLHRAWRLWNEGKTLELADSTIGEDYQKEELTKCIQIGLLCIQEMAIDRPSMEFIVAALSGQSVTLPMPKAPNFFGNSTSTTTEILSYSGTEMITDLCPRE